MKLNESLKTTQQLQQGVAVLKKRRQHLLLWCVLSSTVCMLSIVAGFLQQDIIYGFWGLTTQVQQLHIPFSVESYFADFGEIPDYLVNLFIWLAWFLFKLTAAFIGAFVIVALLKKIRFFYERFQSFILKLVGWLIAFMLIWGALSYLQYDLKDDENSRYVSMTQYQQHVQESELAQIIANQPISQTVEAYLLAQTALLQRPSDLKTAQPYVAYLVQAEQTDAQFLQYGFQNNQLWVMQQQIYGKSLTPIAKAVEPDYLQAQKMAQIVHIILIIFSLISALISIILWFFVQHFQKRTQSIEQRIF